MKTLVVIWILVLVTLIGGFWYMNHEINKLVQETKEPVTSEQIRSAELSGAIEKTYDPQPAGLNK